MSLVPEPINSPCKVSISLSKALIFSAANSCLQNSQRNKPVFGFKVISVAPHFGHLF